VAAGGFLAPRRTALAAQNLAHDKLVDETRAMPETEHEKKAGGGYHPGSPLYNKQEMRKANGEAQAIEKPKTEVGAATQKSSCWEKLWNPFAKVDASDKGVKVKARDWKDPEQHWKDFVAGEGICLLISQWLPGTIITFLLALIWIKGIGGRMETGYPERPNTGEDFAYRLFSLDHCFGHHSHVCLCSWLCGAIRMADTYSKKPYPLIESFWVALLIISLVEGLFTVTLGYSWIVGICAAVYFRQQLRQNYGIQSGGVTLAWDCLFWCCCPCCSIAQEARQVEFVSKLGDVPKMPVTGKV
jgi:Cys-rich protein (TIGR01571 family)